MKKAVLIIMMFLSLFLMAGCDDGAGTNDQGRREQEKNRMIRYHIL